MGDRSNIRFKQSDGHVYLYGHWAGKELATLFQTAFVNAKPRWNDEQYCTAYCVGEIIKTNEGSLTGFGLGAGRSDNERDCLEVDFEAQIVRLRSRDGWHEKSFDWEKDAKTVKEWSFEEFATAKEIHPGDEDD